jgi:hypothetical protein
MVDVVFYPNGTAAWVQMEVTFVEGPDAIPVSFDMIIRPFKSNRFVFLLSDWYV